MRYEAAVELARTIMARYNVDASRFDATKLNNPLLADHDDPIYNLHYELTSTELPAHIAEIATDPDITVEIADNWGGDNDDRFQLRFRWTAPVDDVLSYTGNLGPHKYDQDITGTIRTTGTDIHGEDPNEVTATFTTAEKGTLYRLVLTSRRTDRAWKGSSYKEVSYRLYVGNRERIDHTEEILTDATPEEIIDGWLPEDEGLAHAVFGHDSANATSA